MKEFSYSVGASLTHDADQFRKLYNHYAPVLWRVIYRTVDNDRLTAEEILQDLFVIVHRSIHTFKGNAALSTWLFTIAWRLSVKARKKRNTARMASLSDSFADANSVPNESDIDIEQLLASLTAEERFLLVSREIEGFSFEELSVVTGKSEGAVRTALTRIKKKIRAEWEGTNHE